MLKIYSCITIKINMIKYDKIFLQIEQQEWQK